MPSGPILILGAGGMVGSALQHELSRQGTSFVARTRTQCDITDPAAVSAAVRDADAHFVINCAAYNAVDRAEAEPSVALSVNRDGAEVVARAAPIVVHYSTDFVFDGNKRQPYVEADPPNPQSAYARSKSAGDDAVQRTNPRHFLLRVGCVYGASGKNFGATLLRRLRAGERIRADGERRVQPTWSGAIARQTLSLLQGIQYGLYHAMCKGETTWAGFARELARQAGFDPALIEAVTPAALGLIASRPGYSVLANRGLEAVGADDMPHWRDALERYLEEATKES